MRVLPRDELLGLLPRVREHEYRIGADAQHDKDQDAVELLEIRDLKDEAVEEKRHRDREYDLQERHRAQEQAARAPAEAGPYEEDGYEKPAHVRADHPRRLQIPERLGVEEHLHVPGPPLLPEGRAEAGVALAEVLQHVALQLLPKLRRGREERLAARPGAAVALQRVPEAQHGARAAPARPARRAGAHVEARLQLLRGVLQHGLQALPRLGHLRRAEQRAVRRGAAVVAVEELRHRESLGLAVRSAQLAALRGGELQRPRPEGTEAGVVPVLQEDALHNARLLQALWGEHLGALVGLVDDGEPQQATVGLAARRQRGAGSVHRDAVHLRLRELNRVQCLGVHVAQHHPVLRPLLGERQLP
mmetsp:Transcript_11219/g.29893  ORF Transcript_11219/g.29893 Transcript_11219/m.29893 type:complete len:361 (-) Transcript_11219:432-1514(-)